MSRGLRGIQALEYAAFHAGYQFGNEGSFGLTPIGLVRTHRREHHVAGEPGDVHLPG